ncbi:hypothetical protein B0H14DRAFT_3429470 [Mycena olivaceomarginata]|nr:hypothetical protein B0H14DRAFT_3429470 [Mycena olivaceomarginata]
MDPSAAERWVQDTDNTWRRRVTREQKAVRLLIVVLTRIPEATSSSPPSPSSVGRCGTRSCALPVPAPASAGDYAHAPPLSPVIPPRASAVRSAADLYCPTSTPLPHLLPCAAALPRPFCPASIRACSALSSLSPQRPSRSASTPAPLARVLPALPPCTPAPDPRAAPPFTRLCTGTPVQLCVRTAAAPPSCALPHPFRPASSYARLCAVRTPIPLRIRPAAEPLSRTHPRANFRVGTGASSASGARRRSIHTCVPSAATRSLNPASTSAPSVRTRGHVDRDHTMSACAAPSVLPPPRAVVSAHLSPLFRLQPRARIHHGIALVTRIHPAGVLTTASRIVPSPAHLPSRRVQTPHPALTPSPIPSVFTSPPRPRLLSPPAYLTHLSLYATSPSLYFYSLLTQYKTIELAFALQLL